MLSERQKSVLSLAAAGLTNQEIGRRLAITHSTVREHLLAIRRSLRALNTTHAVAIAVSRQLIDFAA